MSRSLHLFETENRAQNREQSQYEFSNIWNWAEDLNTNLVWRQHRNKNCQEGFLRKFDWRKQLLQDKDIKLVVWKFKLLANWKFHFCMNVTTLMFENFVCKVCLCKFKLTFDPPVFDSFMDWFARTCSINPTVCIWRTSTEIDEI